MKRLLRRVGGFFTSEDDIGKNTKIALSALFIALFIVSDRLASHWGWAFVIGGSEINFRIGLVFLIVAAYILGAFHTAMIAGIGNMLGGLLWPNPMGWWPEITVAWMLTGIIFGVLIYRRRTKGLIRLTIMLIIAVLVNYIAIDLAMRTTILQLRLGGDFWYRLIFRIWSLAIINLIIAGISYPLILIMRKPIDKFLVKDDLELDEGLQPNVIENLPPQNKSQNIVLTEDPPKKRKKQSNDKTDNEV